MQFEQALKLNNLGLLIDEQYGKWGHFHKEAADDILAAASKETEPSFRSVLAAMLSVTIMNESTFNRFQTPNTNVSKRPENIHCPAAWDFSWCQLNFFWVTLGAWQGDFNMKGLPWREVFGSPPFLPKVPFTGNPVTAARACARVILAKSPLLDARPMKTSGISDSLQETQVAHYPEGDKERIEHRRQDWRKYGKLFQEFFEAYI